MPLSPAIPSGIRPCHYFQNDEVVAFASERAPLMTSFDLAVEQVKRGRARPRGVIKKRGGEIKALHGPAAAHVVLVRADLLLARQRPRHLRERKALGGGSPTR
jgi:amidophosphoribosyltransferase